MGFSEEALEAQGKPEVVEDVLQADREERGARDVGPLEEGAHAIGEGPGGFLFGGGAPGGVVGEGVPVHVVAPAFATRFDTGQGRSGCPLQIGTRSCVFQGRRVKGEG